MKIFVAKLSNNIDSNALKELFEPYGTIDSVKVIMDRDTGNSKGYGFVEMPDDDQAYAAIIGLNNKLIDGQKIVVKKSLERTENVGFKPRRK